MIDIEGFKNYLYEDELSENTVTVVKEDPMRKII